MKHIYRITIACLLFSACAFPSGDYHTIEGFTMGTSFRIIFEGAPPAAVQAGVDSLLAQIDRSLSAYNPQSIISKINRNEAVEADSFFLAVFRRSHEIYLATGGAFDISASPLFNAWGFGFAGRDTVTQEKIDSLQQFTGMHHVWLEGTRVVKDDPRVTLNANAIAKGFGVDVLAGFLEQAGSRNFLVEIGGELRCKGKNSEGKDWAIGIDKPVDGNMFPGEHLQTVVRLTDKAMATSGNYRQYYEENGKKVVHTIHPATGYPAVNSLLSATVMAADCMTADAYATAFMAAGLEEAQQLLAAHPELDAYLIYECQGKLCVYTPPQPSSKGRGL
ncbi:MAG: FAD:protein FMN transferase [Prevotellaceae bacterium]|jgi:thiamine biosynthesis lipoprotein|nr:FAD:protein FMN transferase [Prevotellaceae bacterium]